MSWLSDAADLRARRVPSVLVTVVARRGHAPREAGAKMLVTADATSGSVGGGNLEAGAVRRAREMLAAGASSPETMDFALNDKVPYDHGRQCCGGEVTVLLEVLDVPPCVAVFGCGHVGLELARILSRHDLDLWLCDSRPAQLTEAETVTQDAPATVTTRLAVLGEAVVDELPAGAHVLGMTHDHAEDLHLCDAALARDDLGSVGLIGSSAKWARFRSKLAEAGHSPESVAAIQCPVGLPDLGGSRPAEIAVSVAADLLTRLPSR
ncbi:MAG: xanthine dehydrogenase accessory protein XdhC [Corynebacterium sp.]|nr:xanthine dehydrogenase accessory protein XdhC [Corynebacterium sp.]